MDFRFSPSLEHRTLIKITTVLWNGDDIRIMAAKFHAASETLFVDTRKEWRELENKVFEKVYALPLPMSMKHRIASFVEAIGWQILTWMVFHVDRFVTRLPKYFFWKSQGIIDNIRTARMMVQDRSFGDIIKRYKLACTYSLDDQVPVLWDQLIQEELYEKEIKKIRMSELPLVSFWSQFTDGVIEESDILWDRCYPLTPYECMFKKSAGCGNLSSTKYFLQKVSPDQQDRMLLPVARYVAERRCSCDVQQADFPKECYTDVLCYLLTLMNEEQQTRLFMTSPYNILKCFLDWPWQDFFMQMADNMWEFISQKDFKCLLMILVDRTINDFRDHNYQKLFGNFWQRSPQLLKSIVINDPALGSLLSKLFEINDTENIALILNSGTHIEREKVIFYFGSLSICSHLATHNKWDLLKFFVTGCISSHATMMRFKEVFKRFTVDFTTVDRQNCLERFFLLLDYFIREDNKRRNVDDQEHLSMLLLDELDEEGSEEKSAEESGDEM